MGNAMNERNVQKRSESLEITELMCMIKYLQGDPW